MYKDKIFKKKILLFNDTYSQFGGTEVYFFNLLGWLKKSANYQVFTAGFADKTRINSEHFIYNDTKFNFWRYLQRVFFDPLFYLRLRLWIVKINPDIIHLHNINKATNTLLLACRGYKTIQTVHDYGLVCPSLWCVYKDNIEVCNGWIGWQCIKRRCIPWYYFPFLWWHNKTRNFLLKKQISFFLTTGQRLKKYLLDNDFRNILVLPLPIDLDKFQYQESSNKKIILYVGMLEKNKGIEYLLATFQLVSRERTACRLIIIGRGKIEGNLHKICQRLGIEKKVIFRGRISQDEIIENYRQARVVVIPSIGQETFSLVTVEAMACGRPVIGTDRGEIPNFIKDNETGFIVSAKDSKKMAEKILKIMDEEKIFQRFSIAGYKRIQLLFGKQNHYRDLEAIYQRLLE